MHRYSKLHSIISIRNLFKQEKDRKNTTTTKKHLTFKIQLMLISV